MAPHGGVDVSFLSDKARKDLLSLLESVPGKKNLVLQRSLVGQIDLFAKFSTLQEHGIDRIFFLENDNVDSSQRNIIFIAHGEQPRHPRAVAAQIKRLQQSSHQSHDFSVFWVPRRTLLAQSILEEAGVLGELNVGEFELLFQPLDKDLLSLEQGDSFSDLYLRKDPTCIFTAAQALMSIQQRYGLFPRLLGKGDHAQRLVELLLRMRSERTALQGFEANGVPPKSSMPSPEFDGVIIIDREVDFSSALLTQLTYEGLIDESFGIDHSQVELDSSVVGAPSGPAAGDSRPAQPASGSKRKVKLDGTDKLYSSLRDANFAIVGSLLNKVARRLQQEVESRHASKTAAELRDLVSKLPGYQADQQSLKIHTNLAEDLQKQTRTDIFRRTLEVQQNLVAGADGSAVHEIVEDLIARDCPAPTVLRLLCLESTLNGGMRQKDLDHFRRAILQAYGYEHLLTLDALEKMQLLHARTSGGAFAIPGGSTASTAGQTNYSAFRRQLQLIVDDVSEESPADIAYVYSGYAPLSVRLVQCILQRQYVVSLGRSAPSSASGATGSDASQGWRGFEDIVKNVKGRTVDETQGNANRASRAKQVLEGRGGRKTSLVFFLGGITFAEVAALRFIAQQEQEHRRILICTTSMLSGNKMMEAAIKTSQVDKE